MHLRWITAVLLAVAACDAPGESDQLGTDLRLEETLRVGTLDAAGSSLNSVSGVSLTDSTLLILEADPPRLAVFSLEGDWLSEFGRSGDGPGELQRPASVGVLNEQVWVRDPVGRRLEVFRMDGTSARSYRWQLTPDSLGAAAYPMAPLVDGSILAGPGTLRLGAGSRGLVQHRSYYRATESGVLLGEVYREVLSPTDFVEGELPNGGFIVGRHPLPESPLVDIYPDGSGFVVVERPTARTAAEAAFRIRVFAADGSLQTDRRVSYEPLSAERWRDLYVREIERDMLDRTGTVDRGMLETFRDAPAERAFYPPVTRLVAGADGSIWIRREQAAASSVRWEVFARDGEPVGWLSAAVGLRVQRASMEEVWAVQEDDLDVPFVVRLRVLR